MGFNSGFKELISYLFVLSDIFPFTNGLKQGDALSPLILNFALLHGVSNKHSSHMSDGSRMNIRRYEYTLLEHSHSVSSLVTDFSHHVN